MQTLYTVVDCAALLGRDAGTLYSWIRDRRIPGPTRTWGYNGQRKYYNLEDVEQVKALVRDAPTSPRRKGAAR